MTWWVVVCYCCWGQGHFSGNACCREQDLGPRAMWSARSYGLTAVIRWWQAERQRENRWLVKDSYELDKSWMYILYIIYGSMVVEWIVCDWIVLWGMMCIFIYVYMFIVVVCSMIVDWIDMYTKTRWNLGLQKQKIGIVNDRDGSNSTNFERLRKAFHQMFYKVL